MSTGRDRYEGHAVRLDHLQLLPMKTVKPQAPVVAAIIVIIIFSFLFWGIWLFLGYVTDDWNSPPADERSVPAASTY